MSLDTLSDYGDVFQTKTIASLMTDTSFLSKVNDILEPNFFESEANSAIIKIIKNFYSKYKKPPSLEDFRAEINKISQDFIQEAIIDELREVNRYLESTDLEYTKDEFYNFCKNQKMKTAILDSVDYLKSADYEGIKKAIDGAFNHQYDNNIGMFYKTDESVKSRLVENPRNKISETEWDVINEITDGGLGAGDLGIIVGAAGASKTWALVSLGSHALKMGKNVVHFTLELNEKYTGMRYDTKFTSIVPNKLKYHYDEVVNIIENKVKGDLVIKEYPTKTATVNTLKAHLNRLKAFGFDFDLVVVDYGGLLRNDNIYQMKGGSYSEMGSIYEDLRGLAGEFGVPCWTASQAHRSSNSKDIVTGEEVAESYKKVMIADLVISVARKIEDKIQNTARYHIIKNRYGPDGLTFPAKIYTDTGVINIYPPKSKEGEDTTKEMNNNNKVLKMRLSEKIKQYSDDDENKSKSKKKLDW